MSEAMHQLYQQVILDYAKARPGAGTLAQADASSFQVNPTCGDECTVEVRLSGSVISELAWQGRGCSISQASLGMMSERVQGLSIAEAEQLGETFRALMRSRARADTPSQQHSELLEDLAAFSGVAKFPARVKCALLGWMALRDALLKAQYETTLSHPGIDPDHETLTTETPEQRKG